MKRNYLLFIFMLLLWGIVACDPNVPLPDDEATATAEAVETEERDGTAVPEPTPEEGYPIEAPPATAVPDEYPLATVPPPPQSAYPASGGYPAPEGSIWAIRPVGVQCESAEYADIQDAITDLTAIGVEVQDSATFEIPVASVCGGPTSAHFRVLIAAEDVEAAGALGWEAIAN